MSLDCSILTFSPYRLLAPSLSRMELLKNSQLKEGEGANQKSVRDWKGDELNLEVNQTPSKRQMNVLFTRIFGSFSHTSITRQMCFHILISYIHIQAICTTPCTHPCANNHFNIEANPGRGRGSMWMTDSTWSAHHLHFPILYSLTPLLLRNCNPSSGCNSDATLPFATNVTFVDLWIWDTWQSQHAPYTTQVQPSVRMAYGAWFAARTSAQSKIVFHFRIK